jgi:hypothetical protein
MFINYWKSTENRNKGHLESATIELDIHAAPFSPILLFLKLNNLNKYKILY